MLMLSKKSLYLLAAALLLAASAQAQILYEPGATQ